MALIVSDVPAVSAAVFTTNQIKAAPVKRGIRTVERPTARAVVVNSGNANACTGMQGIADAEAMAALTAGALKADPAEIFVCSTGTIGRPLPMNRIARGIEELAQQHSPDGGYDAAEAILTTDLVSKTTTTAIEIDGKPVRITGLAKGSGMIEPNMATMLAFILTDANVEKHALQCALRAATDTSFNRITVDGDRSTNDSVICLANGKAGNACLTASSDEWPLFCRAVERVLFDLAMKIVRDGEGATRVVTVHVKGAASDGEADEAARAVANSMLNKTAWAGTRPNWGRIMDAIGYSHAQVQENRVDIDYDDVPAVRNGMAAPAPEGALQAVAARDTFTLHIHLNLGRGEAMVYTCNFTEGYVHINAE